MACQPCIPSESPEPLLTLSYRDSQTGPLRSYEIHPGTTVREFLGEIESLRKYQGPFQLESAGCRLREDDVLEPEGREYMLRTGLVAGGNGIGGSPTAFVDIEKTISVRLRSGSGCRWRLVDEGLNFCSECITEGCEAYHDTIYVPVGAGKIDIIEQMYEVQCPICKKQAKEPSNMGFYKARFTLNGLTSERKKVTASGETTVGEYLTFGGEGSCLWLCLKADVEVIP